MRQTGFCFCTAVVRPRGDNFLNPRVLVMGCSARLWKPSGAACAVLGVDGCETRGKGLGEANDRGEKG